MGDQLEENATDDCAEEVEFRARQYQEELFNKACNGNTIVFIKTGAGKTFIAIMLIKEKEHEIRKSFDEGGKRTFVLAPTVPLVLQLASVIRAHTGLNVCAYHGTMGVDTWNHEKWNEELFSNEVLVMTPKVLVNILKDGNVKLIDRINLLIFDECHKATGVHDYCEVMLRYKDFTDKPLILGLTASVINGNCKPSRVETEMKNLEKVLHSSIETSGDLEAVHRFATKPEEVTVECLPAGNVTQGLNEAVMDSLVKQIDSINALRKKFKRPHGEEVTNENDSIRMDVDNAEDDSTDVMTFTSSPLAMLKDVKATLHTLGIRCSKSLVDSFLKELPGLKERAKEQLLEDKEHVFGLVEDTLRELETTWKDHFAAISASESMVQNITPRLSSLLKVLRSLVPTATSNVPQEGGREEFRGIIFVEQRIIAWVLVEHLQELAKCLPDDYGYFRVCYIVGHGGNVKVSSNSSMGVKRQSDTLQSFRSGAFNLMVATQVAEEGLDIPKCNVVIRFDLPKNFASYVQSMGRARAEKAQYVLLVEAAEMSRLKSNMAMYDTLGSILSSKSHDRDRPTMEESESHFNCRHIVERYYPTTKDGACVTMYTALDTVYKYCNSFPHDRYTKLCPKFIYTKRVDGLVRCSIGLPFRNIGLARMKEPVSGEFVKTEKLARQLAALELCKWLHKEGELNDNLRPTEHYVQRYASQFGIVSMEHHEKHSPTPGTKKRRQVYDKKVASDLSFAFPKLQANLYLYAICTGPQADEAVDKQIYYGILTSKPISNIYRFNLYGKAPQTVQIKHLANGINIDKTHLSALEEFHCFLFQDVLNLATKAMEYCPQKGHFSFLVVPIARNQHTDDFIDWDLVCRCSTYKNATDTEVSHFGLPSEGDVVSKQYGDDCRFYVLRVCHKLSPRSPLEGYGSHADYIRIRYGKRVIDLDQPLLLVDYGPNTLNLLHPEVPKGTAGKPGRKQHLIPEMCRIFPLNIQSLRCAFFLPSILHRVNGLLLAQELRDEIIAEAKLPQKRNVLSGSLPFLESTCDGCRVGDSTIFSTTAEVCSDTDAAALGALIFQAITTSSAGNWSDMERLEAIGDSFLKYAVSVFLFCTIGTANEGVLSTLRTGLVKNFNLYSHAKAKGIPTLLNAAMFQSRLMWLPPCFQFPEPLRQALVTAGVQRHLWRHAIPEDISNFEGDHGSWKAELKQRWSNTVPALRETAVDNVRSSAENDDGRGASPKDVISSESDDACSEDACDYYTQQLLADKVIADAAEAIIGAVLVACGQVAAVRVIDWLGVKLKPDEYPWTPPATALIMKPSQETLSRIYGRLHELEDQLHYTFREKSFLWQALVHPSYSKEPVTDNYQRLEFLGDAVLDFLVTMQLYKIHPDLSPGRMTDLRSSLVDNETFGFLSVKANLHQHLKYLNGNLFQAINRYIKCIEDGRLQHPKDSMFLIKEDETLNLEEIEIPKALGDVFEAIAGAIFIDSGLSLKAVWDTYEPLMRDYIDRYSKVLPVNPVRVLLEKYNDTKFSKPIKRDGNFIVEVQCNEKTFYGSSNKKKSAKQAAAKAALRAFNIAPQHELRVDH